MGKLKINGCTHCKNGEVFVDHDQYGWYECCLQCGYTRDLPDIAQTAPERPPGAAEETTPERTRSMPVRKEAPRPGGRERTPLVPARRYTDIKNTINEIRKEQSQTGT